MAKRNITVVFDTSVLYTEKAHYLLSLDCKKLVSAHSAHADVPLRWVVPTVVLEERKHRMRVAAKALIPKAESLHKLLNIQMLVDEAKLAQCVDTCAAAELVENGLEHVTLDVSAVDWDGVIAKACSRQLPFEQGDTEKGFKDAMILETFRQVLAASPPTHIVCLVCTDGLMKDAADVAFATDKRVRILATLNDLDDLINTHVQKVSEEHAALMRDKCSDFFLKGTDTAKSVWESKQVHEQVNKIVTEAGQPFPPDVEGVNMVVYRADTPILQKKVQKRWHWLTKIRKNYEGYTTKPSVISFLVPKTSGTLSPPSGSSEDKLDAPKRVIYTLAIVVDVPWSVTITEAGALRSPEVGTAELASVEWTRVSA